MFQMAYFSAKQYFEWIASCVPLRSRPEYTELLADAIVVTNLDCERSTRYVYCFQTPSVVLVGSAILATLAVGTISFW